MRKQTPAKKTTVRKRKSNSPAKRSRRVRYHARSTSRRIVNVRKDSLQLRIPIWMVVGAVVLAIALFAPVDVATRLSGALLQFADWLTHHK